MLIRMKEWYKNLSLKYKFIGFYIVTTVLLITFTLISNAISSSAILQKAVKQSERETKMIAASLDEYLYDVRSYTRLLAIDQNFQRSLIRYNESVGLLEKTQARTELYYRISSYKIAKPVMSDICVLGRDFSPIYENSISGVSTAEMIHTLEYQLDSIPISGIYTDLIQMSTRSGMIKCVALIKPIIDMDYGNRIGVTVFYISEQQIYEKYTAGQFVGDFTIVDDEGNILSSSRRALLDGNLRLPELEAMRRSDRNSMIIKSGGEKLLLAASMMPHIQWLVINHMPLDEVTKENARLGQLLIALALVFLMLGLAGNYVVSRAVIAPIMKLKDVMDGTIYGENTSLRTTVSSQDEVGQLEDGFNKMLDRIDGLMVETNRQQQFLREYEFKLLQAQVNPHFLYNTLEMITMMTGMGMIEQAMQATQRLADFYRLTLSHGAGVIPIRDEIALTSSYMSIQAYRYVEYMQYSIEVDEDIMEYNIPKLTIQPLVENAIYHGIKEKSKGTIEITGKLDQGDVVIMIADNGIGMPQSKIDLLMQARTLDIENQSFGVVSVNTKLKLTYGKEYGLTIESVEGEYTRVTVRLPTGNKRRQRRGDDEEDNDC